MTPKARNIIFAGVIILMILHHDFWLWSDRTLIFGFLPSGLAWHAAYSLVAAAFWILVMKFAWPQALEDFAETGDDEGEEDQ